MDTSEMAALLRPFAELDEKQLAAISKYIDILLRWNSRINLTAIRDPQQIIPRHFGESFFAARHLVGPADSITVADLGSGAGFPGIPLAMWAPASRVTLIESNIKKSTFLHEVIRALGLLNATVFSGRAEDFQRRTNLVTMRAVEKFEAALPQAANLLQPGGRLALMIGSSQITLTSTTLPSFPWDAPIDIPGGHSRVLLVGTKPVKVE